MSAATGATLLAVDCGTQSLRAMLFARDGALLDRARVPYEPYRPSRPGWAEQEAGVYWDALCAATRTLRERSGPAFARVQGLAVAALRNTPVLVDGAGEPVRPAIVWLDTRKADRVYRPGWPLALAYGAAGLLPALAQVQADCKTSWVRQHEPETWARTVRVLQVSGFLNHRLTGRFADSVACQVGHLPFDYRAQRWCAPGQRNARLFPVPPTLLPDLLPPGRPLGTVTRSAGAATGLPEGLPVIAGAADKGAEGLGCGCLDPTRASLSLGTAATVQLTSRRYFEPLAHLPPYPAALPGHYSHEVQVSRGYWLIAWFLREFAGREREEAGRRGVPPESLLDDLLATAPAGSLGLVALPQRGARLRAPEARGALVGLGGDHTRAHVYRSLIEGLAFTLRDGLERIERAGRVRPDRLAVAGGASQSPAICQITADVLGRELWAGETFEATGLGAAVLAAVGTGLYASPAEAVRAMVRPGRVYLPEPRASERYRQLYLRVHRRIGARLAPLDRELDRILGGPGAEPGS